MNPLDQAVARMDSRMRQAFVDTVSSALDTDPRLAVVLADITAAAFTAAQRRHPDRVINVGIREQCMIGVAGGLALTGLRPVVHSYAPFLVERPFEQIKLDLGHQDVGAVLVSIGGSYDDPVWGRTHQAPGDVALLDTLPGWTVHVPGHAEEVEPLMRSALAGDGRVYVRLSSRANARPQPDLSGFQVLKRGRLGVVLAVGPMLDNVLHATRQADVTVLYAATVRPFDQATLRSAVLEADRAAVVLVEPYLAGTSVHLVNEALSDIPHQVRSLGVRRDVELRAYGEPADHDALHGLDVASIEAKVEGLGA
ncbi:transketolase [Amycolatopsis taiwanensis]|uniref:Transketolase n=2 Tax=Amycolatopsis taiwanensis TaxID=342230 RepID=A0A9W6VHC8_9PSEU|nr:transketolase [Amycolatopsis taiwanensis]